MSRQNHLIHRFSALLIALSILFTLAAAPSVQAVTQSEINALKNNAADLKNQKAALQKKMDALSNDISDVLAKKANLDSQIEVLSSQIENTTRQINTYTALITQTEAELAEAEEQEAAQYQLFCERVRAMEERGTISYWAVLFKASSFSDLLGRLDFINEIMDADQRVIDRLKDLQEQIAAKKAELEDSKAGAEEAKAELDSQKSELNSQRKEAAALVEKLQANQDAYESTMSDLDAEEDAIQAEIVQKSRQLAAEQEAARKKAAEEAARKAAAAAAAQNKTSNSNTTTTTAKNNTSNKGTTTTTTAPAPATTTTSSGGYAWPVPSRKINSGFGSRNTGIKGASKNHKGIDIGGVGYSTTVTASKAGTVIVSQKSSSYGNYVVISHGSGNTTLYAHMSSRSVSVGDTVSQGQAIGVTGSTGISSGPHLHFEVTIGGSRVNPLNYLP